MLNKILVVGMFLFLGLAGPVAALDQFKANHAKQFVIKSLDPAGRFDPSGLTADEHGNLFVVSDRPQFNDIYRLSLDSKTGRGQLTSALVIPPAVLKDKNGDALTDFEGVTYCDGNFYVAEEAASSLIRVPKEAPEKAERLVPNYPGLFAKNKLDYKALTPPSDSVKSYADRGAGEGLEGVACDPKGGRLFLAKERGYRMLFVWDFNLKDLTRMFDPATGYESPRLVEWKGQMALVSSEFSDLVFRDGFLYALERSNMKVSKLDPNRFSVVAEMSFAEGIGAKGESGRFVNSRGESYEEPFGMAEGLWVGQDNILVLFDNNDFRLKESPTQGDSLLLEIKRPKGF